MTQVSRKRCIVVGAGDFFGFPFSIQKDDYVIAADAGYEVLKQAGIRPSLIVGDFDSMKVAGICGETGPVHDLDINADAEKAEYLRHLRAFTLDGIDARAIDPVKNDPDLLAAVRIGMAEGCTEFHLIGATGKRIDHTMANFQILGFLAERGCRGVLYDRSQAVTAIHNSSMRFPAEMRGYFSALSLSDFSRGITESGFKYILRDAVLRNTLPTGLSNEFVGTGAEISVEEGTLLLIFPYTIA